MADYKRQHYVPRCHFKPFSVDGNGDAVNLFNFNRKKAVRCAPVKGQCARDYMYGEDLILEKAFQRIEGAYARVLRTIAATPRALVQGDIEILRLFAAIQHFRTDSAIRRTHEMSLGMESAMFERRPQSWVDHRPNIPDDREIMHMTMRAGIQSCRVFNDLEACLVINRTKDDFITSDDPAIFTSRYYFQKIGHGNFGLASAGAMLMLPLSAKHLILFYDGNVYMIPTKQGECVCVDKTADVFFFNELQYLKASKNVYFANFSDARRVQQEFSQVEPNRPERWFTISTFVQDEHAPPDSERYRRVADDEQLESRTALVAVSARYPRPSRWYSGLRFRSKPRAYSNGSAIGYVRKPEWLTREGFECDTGRKTQI
jgi:hypothetical protein